MYIAYYNAICFGVYLVRFMIKLNEIQNALLHINKLHHVNILMFMYFLLTMNVLRNVPDAFKVPKLRYYTTLQYTFWMFSCIVIQSPDCNSISSILWQHPGAFTQHYNYLYLIEYSSQIRVYRTYFLFTQFKGTLFINMIFYFMHSNQCWSWIQHYNSIFAFTST